ncbi:MAG TPA: hypothetical protein VN873_01645 [Candidatus Angelobacter sp.]|nr:hypothetical protein [Candidatus Angelobacter sp.]
MLGFSLSSYAQKEAGSTIQTVNAVQISGNTFKDVPLLVIAHDAHGVLKDFRVIKDLASVHSIIVTPPPNEKEIYVTVLGKDRNRFLEKDMAVGSKDEAGFQGRIEIDIKDGVAIAVMGNFMVTPSPVSPATLDTISSKIQSGHLLQDDKSLIKINRIGAAAQTNP